MLFQTAGVLAAASVAAAATSVDWPNQYTATGTAAVAAAAATAKTESPTSRVRGKAFDRICIVYFENTDFNKAVNDVNFHSFAEKGLTMTNYFAVTHPSQPNYVASIAGDYFGMDNDEFWQIPSNVSTIIDLLEERGISWGAYMEDMPYSGFEGFHFLNQQNGKNDYVRKHNPPVIFNSVAGSEDRLAHIKNVSLIDESRSMFHKDLRENKLPQWMFITPNMTDDGHDTDVTVAGQWAHDFLTPLLHDRHFMDNTLLVLTWDENETYEIQNNILSIVLGDALPRHLVGQTDDTYYNHYSELATVQANWDLPTLGRWDVGANPYQFVADKTGEKTREWDPETLANYYYNQSYAGLYNAYGPPGNTRLPSPNLNLENTFNGRKVADSVKKMWAGSSAPTYYTDSIMNNDGQQPPAGYASP